jgi:hypothetical protein
VGLALGSGGLRIKKKTNTKQSAEFYKHVRTRRTENKVINLVWEYRARRPHLDEEQEDDDERDGE